MLVRGSYWLRIHTYMRTQVCFLMLVLASGLGFAQSIPDFSGVFLRERIEDHGVTTVITETENPLILDIKQDADTLRVTEMQHGVQTEDTYDLSGKPTINLGPDGVRSRDVAKFFHGTLILRSKWTDPQYSGAPATEETWELSPDLQTLTIQPKIKARRPWPQDFRRVAIFSRQPSLQAALERARAASGVNKCKTYPQQRWRGRSDLSRRIDFGYTDFEQLVSLEGFQAYLSGNFFSGLKRKETASQAEFRKDGRLVQTYDGSLDLEIIPWIKPHPLYLFLTMVVVMGWGPNRLPESLLNLRFHIKWVGSDTRDLGEVPSKLEQIPWSKDGTISRKVYRIQVPAQGVPITDSLEIHILSAAGTQLGCISGHI